MRIVCSRLCVCICVFAWILKLSHKVEPNCYQHHTKLIWKENRRWLISSQNTCKGKLWNANDLNETRKSCKNERMRPRNAYKMEKKRSRTMAPIYTETHKVGAKSIGEMDEDGLVSLYTIGSVKIVLPIKRMVSLHSEEGFFSLFSTSKLFWLIFASNGKV